MYKVGDRVQLLNNKTTKTFFVTTVFNADVLYLTIDGESKLFASKGDLIIESEDKMVTYVVNPGQCAYIA